MGVKGVCIKVLFAPESEYVFRSQNPQKCKLKIDQVKKFQALGGLP
jgi:hypothetical protein